MHSPSSLPPAHPQRTALHHELAVWGSLRRLHNKVFEA